MAYISLYRKWRPQTFGEVIGQEFVTRTLENSLRSGNFAHAYLFTGPRGTGKTSTARILAKALNCEEGPTPNPCNACRSCIDITGGSSVDVIEIDAASNRGIDDIRELRERVVFSPAAARVKVYILDEAHMLTPPAFNALLKMLEEPPAHVVFVLATTEPHKMPPTILSRCQRFDFRSVPVTHLVEHLSRVSEEEGAKASESALRLIARRARGSARDALVILEQVMSYSDGVVEEEEVSGFLGLIEDETLVQLGDSLACGDAAEAISLVDKAYEEGRDLVQFARGAQEHFRRVFLLQHADLSPEDLEVDESAYECMRRQAAALQPGRTLHFINALREAIREMQATSSPRLVLEGALIGMARSELDASPEALSARLEKLERELERWIRKSGEDKKPPVGDQTPASEPKVAMPLDLAAVRRAWPQVREKVKQKKITTHAFLLEGKPLEVQGGELAISFPPNRSFHCGEIQKENHRRVLEEALEEVLGVGLKVSARVEEEEAGRDPAEEGDKAGGGRRARREPAVEKGPEEEEDARVTRQDEKNGEAAPVSGDKRDAESHDAGKVKLVRDIFGAEMIEEKRLGEEG